MAWIDTGGFPELPFETPNFSPQAFPAVNSKADTPTQSQMLKGPGIDLILLCESKTKDSQALGNLTKVALMFYNWQTQLFGTIYMPRH